MNIELKTMHESFLSIAERQAKKYKVESFYYRMYSGRSADVAAMMTCSYTDGTKPMCIVGAFMVEDLGASIEDLEWYDDNETVGSDAINGLLDEYVLPAMNSTCCRYVDEIQYRQDQGHSWTESANMALSYVKRHFSELV